MEDFMETKSFAQRETSRAVYGGQVNKMTVAASGNQCGYYPGPAPNPTLASGVVMDVVKQNPRPSDPPASPNPDIREIIYWLFDLWGPIDPELPPNPYKP